MRIKNLDDLDRRIKELSAISEKNRTEFFNTTDRTRDVAGSVQRGFYLGQLGLKLFRTLTNYHLPPKKRMQRVLVTISSIIVARALRKFISSLIKKKSK